jgi:hypothetical protein
LLVNIHKESYATHLFVVSRWGDEIYYGAHCSDIGSCEFFSSDCFFDSSNENSISGPEVLTFSGEFDLLPRLVVYPGFGMAGSCPYLGKDVLLLRAVSSPSATF